MGSEMCIRDRYVNSRIVETITFSDEVLSTLPGCSGANEEIDSTSIFTEEEFSEMQKRAELCFDSQIEYLRSNKNLEGVTFNYHFE